jgi:hypothetical protein
VHLTPKYGNWLNLAEIELGVIGRQCLGDRSANQVDFEEKVRKWADI